jgi:hypothetical protein
MKPKPTKEERAKRTFFSLEMHPIRIGVSIPVFELERALSRAKTEPVCATCEMHRDVTVDQAAEWANMLLSHDAVRKKVLGPIVAEIVEMKSPGPRTKES